MQRFQRILVVVDEKTENRAFVERAVSLALRNDARLTVVNPVGTRTRRLPRTAIPEQPVDVQELPVDIIEEWPPGAGLPVVARPPAPHQEPVSGSADAGDKLISDAVLVIREQIIEEESQRLEQWVDFVRQSGVQAHGKVLNGTPFLAVIREVLLNEYDLVMIAAASQGRLKERFLGSTAMHLMRKCPCPVWVVRPSQIGRHTRVLAAVDPNPLDEEKHAVSVKVMDLATALARRQQSELLVVHTWTFAAEPSMRSGYLVASAEVDNWVRQAQDLHRRRLTELLLPYPLDELQAQVYMLKGEPGSLIPELASKLEVGLIIMGTVSRSGVAGLLIGSSAERILRHVRCSVLTVKPDGFITPVRLDE